MEPGHLGHFPTRSQVYIKQLINQPQGARVWLGVWPGFSIFHAIFVTLSCTNRKSIANTATGKLVTSSQPAFLNNQKE